VTGVQTCALPISHYQAPSAISTQRDGQASTLHTDIRVRVDLAASVTCSAQAKSYEIVQEAMISTEKH